MTFRLANELIAQLVIRWKVRHGMSRLNTDFEHLDNTPVTLFQNWLGHLQEAGSDAHIFFLEKELSVEQIVQMIEVSPLPIIVFRKGSDIVPSMAYKEDGEYRHLEFISEEWKEFPLLSIDQLHSELLNRKQVFQMNPSEVKEESLNYCLIPLAVDPLVTSDDRSDEPTLTPMQRFIKLFMSEHREIFYIYIYAIMSGLLGLTLPLGVQSIIGLVSGGMILNSVIVLIGLVILGTFLGGALQIMQLTIVETLQQRIFTRAAFEFAFRIPRIRLEYILKEHAPELMNRFFDILTIQKGFAKILTDLVSALLQAVFGMILLSFYHSSFIVLSLFLFLVIAILFYATWTAGLETSLSESKYKYKVAHWLEELARTLTTFKLIGNTFLPMNKMHEEIKRYLDKRRKHFQVLMIQYGAMVFFKTFIIGGVLIIGSLLVVEQKITLGQFVASELVVITVMVSIEKLILNLDLVYDILTAVEKVGAVTDLPLESRKSSVQLESKTLWVQAKDLSYKYPETSHYILKNISLEVLPKQYVGVIGNEGSGKTTLMYVLTGMLQKYEGIITYNGFSLRDMNLKNVRDHLGDNLSHEDIFDGSILENISVGRLHYTYAELQKVLDIVELTDMVNRLPDGLDTHLMASGKNLPSSTVKKIILARSLLGQPKLIVFDDFFYNLEGSYKKRMVTQIMNKEVYNWSILAASHDPLILKQMDKIYLMQNGVIVNSGTYEELKSDPYFCSLMVVNENE